MICILDPLTCSFTKVLVYELFTSDFGVQQEGNKKVWQGNMNKNRFKKFQDHYPDYCKNDTSSYKAFVNKFPKIIENIKSLGKKDPAAKNQFYLYFLQTPGLTLNSLKRPNILQQTAKDASRIRYTRKHYRNCPLKPKRIVGKPSCMILMEKSQLFFRMSPMKL